MENFEPMVIVLDELGKCQSKEDMGISKKLRNNYVLILLGASALDQAEKWKADDDKRLFVESQSYPCMLSGSVRNCPALHPTHHQYQQYRIQGTQPLNLLPINQIHGGDPSGDSEAARPSICLDKSPAQDHAITQNPALREWFDHLYRLGSRNHAELEDIPLECPDCESRNISCHAKNRNGSQRYRCGECGKTFTI